MPKKNKRNTKLYKKDTGKSYKGEKSVKPKKPTRPPQGSNAKPPPKKS